MLSWLLPSDDPGIVDLIACFGCSGDVFTGRFLAMDVFMGPLFWL
jgi:hypothetical protein